jgi:prefoldin subunit 5
MVPGFVTFLFLFCVVESRMYLEVSPKIIEPRLTSELRLRCQVDQYEKGQIVSFFIYRNTINARKGNVSPNETIVEMRGPDPIEITIAPGYEKLNASGGMPVSKEEISRRWTELKDEFPRNWTNENQIEWSLKEAKLQWDSWESQSGPALFVEWPEPGVEDLGIYTCEVTFLEADKEQTWSATATLTASLKYLDQLLVNVLEIEKEAQVFNQTLTGFQAELYNIRKDLDELHKVRNEANRHATPVQVNDTEAEIWLNETATDEHTQAEEPGPELQRLTRALENLEANFYKFNEVLERVDKIIAALEDKVDEEWPENKTTAVQVDDWSVNKTSDVQVEEWPVNKTRYDEELTLTGTRYVDQGGQINLQCNATGGLQIAEKIDWIKNGNIISESKYKDYVISTYRSNEQGALVSTLQVSRAYTRHAGIYLCRSSNNKYDSIVVNVLRVEETPVHTTSKVEEDDWVMIN